MRTITNEWNDETGNTLEVIITPTEITLTVNGQTWTARGDLNDPDRGMNTLEQAIDQLSGDLRAWAVGMRSERLRTAD